MTVHSFLRTNVCARIQWRQQNHHGSGRHVTASVRHPAFQNRTSSWTYTYSTKNHNMTKVWKPKFEIGLTTKPRVIRILRFSSPEIRREELQVDPSLPNRGGGEAWPWLTSSGNVYWFWIQRFIRNVGMYLPQYKTSHPHKTVDLIFRVVSVGTSNFTNIQRVPKNVYTF